MKGTSPSDLCDEDERADEFVGEVLICYPVAVAQATEHGRTTEQEVTDLLIHGVLHILGYDHEVEADAQIMLPLQQKIYAELT